MEAKIAYIENGWLTLVEKRNGLDVQRKYAGHTNSIRHEDDSVETCVNFYWERELYPNGVPMAPVRKSYLITNLAPNVTETYRCEAMNVLDYYIGTVGQEHIVDKTRETLLGLIALPINAPDGYPLYRDTREQLPLIPE